VCVVILSLYLTMDFVISSLIVSTFKSACIMLLDIYHGAFTFARRALFWYLCNISMFELLAVECVWNLMAHCDAREGKWRGNWRMEWVASTLHTTTQRDVSSITKADSHASAASSRLNWRPRRFKWTRPFRRKRSSGFCACAITFQTQSTPVGYTVCPPLPENTQHTTDRHPFT
jgi:hypothetical protein